MRQYVTDGLEAVSSGVLSQRYSQTTIVLDRSTMGHIGRAYLFTDGLSPLRICGLT